MNASDMADRPRKDSSQIPPEEIGPSDLIRRTVSFRSSQAGSDRISTSSKDQRNSNQSQNTFNEATPIVRNPESPGRLYQSTDNSKNHQSGQGNNQSKNPPQQNSGNPGDQGPESNGSEEHHTSWYNRLIDKFGSVELDNKGSVARDHLALGWLSTLLLTICYRLTTLHYRENLFSLAKDFIGLCIYWDCSHPAFPFKFWGYRSR